MRLSILSLCVVRMVRVRALILLCLLFCALCKLVISNYEEDFVEENEDYFESDELFVRNKRDTADSICKPNLFLKVSDCCDVPMLLPLAGFVNCSSGLVSNDRQVVKLLGRSFIPQNPGTMNSSLPAGRGRGRTRNGTVVNFRNVTGGRLCIYECVFNGQALVDSKGALDFGVINSKFLAVVSQTWRPIVQAAVANCSQQLTGLNTTALMKASGGRVCKPEAALLMSCIFRYTNMNCPNAVAYSGDSCKESLQKLKNCDVFTGLRANKTQT